MMWHQKGGGKHCVENERVCSFSTLVVVVVEPPCLRVSEAGVIEKEGPVESKMMRREGFYLLVALPAISVKNNNINDKNDEHTWYAHSCVLLHCRVGFVR